MPGFPLAALGAGLGEWVKNQQEQQAQRERQQMLALQLQNYQQQMEDRQRDRLGQYELGRLDLSGPGGGTGIAPAPTSSVGVPIQNAGGADPLSLISKYESNGQNIKNPTSSASGPWQFLDSTWRETAPTVGIDTAQYPTAMSAPIEMQKRAAQALYDKQGYKPWAPYNPRLAAAIGSGASAAPADSGGPVGRPTQVADESGQIPGYPTIRPGAAGKADRDYIRANPREMQVADASGAQPADASGSAAAPQASSAPSGDLAAEIAKIPMPSLPNLDIEAKRRQINQQAPHAPWERKEQALRDWISAHGKEAERQYDQSMKLYENQRSVVIEQWRENHSDAQWQQRHRIEVADRPGTIKEGPGGSVSVTGTIASPITMAGTGEPLNAGKPGKPQLLEYTAEDGKVERVQAQQLPSGQWVTADQLRAPIDVSKGKWSIVPASQANALGGSRDAAQRERQLIAGREVISDLQNVVSLPITTTRGIFGGRTQGPGLFDALKENLAEKMTNEDAELANSALAGLERELSIIVSPVYGGKWAAESFGALKLKEGQTNAVKLYNLARMRQTADNALEAMTKSNRIGEAQKQYAVDMRDMLDKAVPWTPADVLAFRSKRDTRQTFSQFVADRGVGGAAKKGGGQAAPGGPASDAAPAQAAPGGDVVIQNGMRFNEKTGEYLGPAQP